MPRAFDVAVIGAGPTGLTLAALLGQAGLRVVLVEANSATGREPRAVSIDDEALRVMQQLGLDKTLKAEIVSGYGSQYLGPDGEIFLRVEPKAEPYGHPRRNAFRQPLLEAQLRDRLADWPNVEARFGLRAESLSEDVSGVSIALRPADGEVERITASYVVGCDGARSFVRHVLGFMFSGDSLGERWLIVDLDRCRSASPETRVYCDPRQPGIMLPGPRDTRRYEFKLAPGQSDAQVLADAHVDELLRSHDHVPGGRIVRKAVYRFHARIAERWGRGRIWLAGDAAHLMPPFAGQGMNGGIRDAANLAWKLQLVVSGRAGPRLLETYELERRGHVREMIRLALAMGAIFSPRSSLHGRLTRAGFRALGLWPAAKAWFGEMKYKPAPRFSGGFLIRSQMTRGGIVGRMLPQPCVASEHGPLLLDDLLGDGFALIGVGISPSRLAAVSLGVRWDSLVQRRVSISTDEAPGLAQHAGRLLLVRPDRYVMARFRVRQAATLATELSILLDQTWPSPKARNIPAAWRAALAAADTR
jgi:3-(3-hydroxy-phenyl)propionate hydroxylase